jgi:hypothetical protein
MVILDEALARESDLQIEKIQTIDASEVFEVEGDIQRTGVKIGDVAVGTTPEKVRDLPKAGKFNKVEFAKQFQQEAQGKAVRDLTPVPED